MGRILTLLLLMVLGCNKSSARSPEAFPDKSILSKMALYTSLRPTVVDVNGFIYTDECDSLLFTSLASIGLPGVDLRAAREPNGRWQRRPSKDCYPDHSSSTISRDMILGVIWYAYYHRDLELVESLWSYGSQRSWIMGDGPRSRTLLSPGLVATLAQTIYRLGGEDHHERYLLPQYEAPGQTDFEAHLQVLHILLRLRVYSSIDDNDQKRLQEQVERQPKNALFQYAVGNVEEAVRLLNDESHWPSDHLPTTSNHCSRWVFERDDGVNWSPCEPTLVHSGGELLFLGYLITHG